MMCNNRLPDSCLFCGSFRIVEPPFYLKKNISNLYTKKFPTGQFDASLLERSTTTLIKIKEYHRSISITGESSSDSKNGCRLVPDKGLQSSEN